MKKICYANIHFDQDNQPISAQFDDIYFSKQDGLQEADYVFLQGNQLWQRWQQFHGEHFVIAEAGFGTGLNFFATLALFRQFRSQYPDSSLKRLFFISFEKYPLRVEQLKLAQQAYPQFSTWANHLQRYWHHLVEGCLPIHFDDVRLDLWFGDIADNLPQLGDVMIERIDAWFLDGFAPSKNPQMWNDELYQFIARYTKLNGTFATFTAASAVRKGLQNVGFQISKRKGFGKKRECLQGIKTAENLTAVLADNAPKFPWYLPQMAQDCVPNKPRDIAIVGGGVAAFFCAYALMQRGAKVTLYCADQHTALNASGNKQGAFYPQLSDDDELNCRFYVHSFAYGRQQFDNLSDQIDFPIDYCGVALCGYDAKSQAKLEKIAQLDWLADGFYQPQTAQQLSEKVGLALPCGGGLIAQGGWLAPQQLVQQGFAFLQKQGLVLKTQQQIQALLPNGTHWQLENQNGERFSHQIILLANGDQINQFSQTQVLPTYPVRGQVSEIATTPNLQKLKAVLCYDGYLTPINQTRTRHCLGASHLRDSADRHFSQQEQQENQAKIQHNLAGVDWISDIDTSDNHARVGIRCAVRDRVPLVGNVPDYTAQLADYKNVFNQLRRKQTCKTAAVFSNLFLLGALGSRGFTSAPLLSEILASQIYGEPLPISADILHNLTPNRSWMRKLLKGCALKDL
ncbi:MAG: bifunctional tRNA (5-methylaminomethyl-2-thiouridine)(34)-methyltransferase MnmD/FAD-dependent 5-carboxymethylaminomethyl-2-thiouridine(34) oxidoreductase MnmC [Pasteurellaceae bacterium]|nr:bifunctional tRNA (5-methylaminomethyl-2-thiouridine)(34)-methyltransferase MnmD/FAD-dependent 5-carboxymethylaminomethyl-2-thiouridine(34) oxidoreductase MnmC [Pasteurellaceae bacterium]